MDQQREAERQQCAQLLVDCLAQLQLMLDQVDPLLQMDPEAVKSPDLQQTMVCYLPVLASAVKALATLHRLHLQDHGRL